MAKEVRVVLPLVGEHGPRRGAGCFWSSGNVLCPYLGGSYTSVHIYKNILSCTLQICTHVMTHLCMLYTLMWGLEFFTQRGSLPLCLQAISYNSATVTSLPQSVCSKNCVGADSMEPWNEKNNVGQNKQPSKGKRNEIKSLDDYSRHENWSWSPPLWCSRISGVCVVLGYRFNHWPDIVG